MTWTETPGPSRYDFRDERWEAHIWFDFDHWEWEVIELETRHRFGGTASSVDAVIAKVLDLIR